MRWAAASRSAATLLQWGGVIKASCIPAGETPRVSGAQGFSGVLIFEKRDMSLSKVSHLPLAALLATLIMVGMPALARLHPKPAEDPWLKLRPQLHPVAGTLICDGKPVVGASVTFVAQTAEEGREYLAVSSTDKDGRFWLRTFSSHGDGAVAGAHFIKVEKMVPTGRMVAGPGMESILDIGTIPFWLRSETVPGAAGPGMALSHTESPIMDPMLMDPMMGYCAFPGMPEMVNILPSRFADEKTSGLTAEVCMDGVNEFRIELSTEPPVVEQEASDDGERRLEHAVVTPAA